MSTVFIANYKKHKQIKKTHLMLMPTLQLFENCTRKCLKIVIVRCVFSREFFIDWYMKELQHDGEHLAGMNIRRGGR